MIDGNLIRAEFARYLHEHTHTRWGLDAALMHVGRICYDQGVKDGEEKKHMDIPILGSDPPASDHMKEAERLAEHRTGPASDADMEVYQSIADGYARDTAPAPAEVPMPDNEALRLYVRALCKAVDAATDFAGTVAGGASWWDDVWTDHAAALDRARERISQAALRGKVKP